MEIIAEREIPIILIVDDDPVARMQLRLCLDREGYQIVEAKDGIEGLATYSQFQPDIVLLDVMMPGLDGFECCMQLQALPRDQQAPILMVTTLDDYDSVNRAFTAGASDYVTKPVHLAVLQQRVRRLLQQVMLQRQLEAANQELRRLALVDGLTQVANRRQFDERLEHEWQQLFHKQQPLSLILCDIDYFKLYNDTYGHQAGDQCLQRVAKAIQAAIAHPALVARYGGEEFAILLPYTELQIALQIAQQIHTNLAILAIPHSKGVNAYVTLSTGLAGIIPGLDSTSNALISAADQALYQAKREGRNRCCLYKSDTSVTVHDVRIIT